MKKLIVTLLVPLLAMYFVSIEDFNELEDRVEQLESAEVQEEYTDCNLMELLSDVENVRENGYTFVITEEGLLIEYKDGIPTGDIFTEENLQREYCEVK